MKINDKIETKDNINDISSSKEDDNYIILDEPIQYNSSPKIGLVSINNSRNKINKYNNKFTKNEYDIRNTISMNIVQIKSKLEEEENFFKKGQYTNIKLEKNKENKAIGLSSYSNMNIKVINKGKYNILAQEELKKFKKIKRFTKNTEKLKNEKRQGKNEKLKDIFTKRKSCSISMIPGRFKKKKKINNEKPIKERYLEENKNNDKDEENKKEEIHNIVIYGNISSSENIDSDKIHSDNNSDKDKENENEEEFLKLKRHSNISTGDLTIKKNASLDKKIIKPRVKPTSYITSKLKINQAKTKKSKTSRKFTSNKLQKNINLNNHNNINNNNKYNSTNQQEKKKYNLIKILTTKNIFKEDNNQKKKHSNLLMKKQVQSSRVIAKDMKNIIKQNSNFKLVKEEEHLNNEKKELEFPKIAINKENNTKEVHLLVKGKEETIINYTNTQMIQDEKEYMIECLKILSKIKKEEMPRCKQKVNFNFPPEEKQKKIALFDLDETLVHCNNNNQPGMDGDIVSVNLPTNKTVKIGLNIRKNWQKAFDLIKDLYHIVIYTASHPSYADAVLDYLDKDNKYCKYRLYRNHCVQCDIDGYKFYVKDLDTLDYNLKDIILIDNSILSFAYHLYNGIPIVPFINQPNDTELIFTAHYLISIAKYDDLPLENKKHLNLDNLLSMATILNEIEDNEEEEEEEEDEKIDIAKEIKINNDTKKGLDKEEKEKDKINPNKEINKENNNNPIGKINLKKSQKTLKISESMKKDLDEMFKKKKESLEKIDE